MPEMAMRKRDFCLESCIHARGVLRSSFFHMMNVLKGLNGCRDQSGAGIVAPLVSCGGN